MPKAVDIYVLEKKIGSGQFGDVFKGYSKVDRTEVAIKTIRRDRVKGKFTQLLDNEIQVLKSCRNNNIIRLIDIKKTVNNIYLVLEFCNQGDLGAYMKQKKMIPEEEAIQYFVQILHAFQTLTKNKILHRDFKLPNVLKHDGVIKIADFGFAKLLGEEDEQAQTILGSPLNMAPQVLNHEAYNNKADIWSIGVAFYEMIFGKQSLIHKMLRVPYIAANIVDLLKKIKKEPLSFPRQAHPYVHDVLTKMLVVDPTKRIEWSDLFQHPITRFLEDQIEDSLNQSMLCQNNDLPFNISKFYIKNNRVIDNTHDLVAKEQLNKYVRNVLDNKQTKKYEGPMIKRKNQRENKENIKTADSDGNSLNEVNKTEKNIEENFGEITELQLNNHYFKDYSVKKNTRIVLLLRNKYTFFGHVAEEALEINHNKYAFGLAFLLVKKVVETLNMIVSKLKAMKLEGIVDWKEFVTSLEYSQLMRFLEEQEQIFNKFYEKLSLKVLEEGNLSEFEEEMMISGKFTREETNVRIYRNVLEAYVKKIESNMKCNKALQVHLIKILEGSTIDQWANQIDFDFNRYYADFNALSEKDCLKKVTETIAEWKKQII